MKKIIFTTVLMGVMSLPAMADLRVVASDTYVGTKCYDEEYSYASRYSNSLVYKTVGPSYLWNLEDYEADRCPDSFDDWRNSPEGQCWLGYENGALYACAKRAFNNDYENKKDCEWSIAWVVTDEWMATGNNRVSKALSITGSSVGNYTCNAVVGYEYGCVAGYYQSGGSGASMTCSKCPTPGTSDIGNTEISRCYVPSGSGYGDGSGTFKVSGKCWHD